VEQARALAERVGRQEGGDYRSMIERLYVLLYSRQTAPQEIAIGQTILAESGRDERVLEEYCQVLLSANEFVYID
jgi:predicted Zn-dependent protease